MTVTWQVDQGDCPVWLAGMPNASVDLVLGSPPYESARLYLEDGQDMGIARDTEQWVAWMVEVFRASLRVCRGLVAFVVEGQTKNYRYSSGPALLMADLHRAGVHLRKPLIYRRVGIPGSGGPDWLRNDWEWILCATGGGKLPWSDNTACGHPPKWALGGEMSHRQSDGMRVNQRTRSGTRQKPGRLSHRLHQPDGSKEEQHYDPPAIANPGNVVQEFYTAEEVADMLGEVQDLIDCTVGGGQMGNTLASLNEAPFPERLCEVLIRSFCPPGGLVLDPFTGSGTTGAVAIRCGRSFRGCDLRQSQVQLARRRIMGETPDMFAGLETSPPTE